MCDTGQEVEQYYTEVRKLREKAAEQRNSSVEV